MKNIEVKKLVPYVAVMIMCMSVTACGQSTTTTTTSEDTIVSTEEALTGNDGTSSEEGQIDGKAPENGEAPEKPDGEAPEGQPGL